MKKNEEKIYGRLQGSGSNRSAQGKRNIGCVVRPIRGAPQPDLAVEAGVFRELPEGIFRGGRERERRAGEPRCALCQDWTTGNGAGLDLMLTHVFGSKKV